MFKLCAVFCLVVCVFAQDEMRSLPDLAPVSVDVMQQGIKRIETYGIGMASIQPDIAKIILSINTLGHGQMQQQNQTIGAATGAAMAANQTSALMNQTGMANETSASLNQTAENLLNQTSNVNQSTLPVQQQPGQIGQLEQNLATQALQLAQQVNQSLASGGASNVSFGELAFVGLPSQQPFAVLSVVFECPLDQANNLISQAMQQGATSVEAVRFKASKTVIQQGSQSAIQDAIQDCLTQAQTISSAVSGAGGQMNQTAGAANILKVKVLGVQTLDEPLPEEQSASFLSGLNNLIAQLQSGNLVSNILGGGQQMQGGQQNVTTMPFPLASAPQKVVATVSVHTQF